jgi:general secretion pathway protein D
MLFYAELSPSRKPPIAVSRRFKSLAGIVAVLATVFALLLPASPGLAQSAQAPPPTSLVKLELQPGDGGGEDLLLTFDQRTPLSSVISNDNQHPLIGFANAAAAPNLASLGTASGIWQSIRLVQEGTTLAVALTAPQPISVRLEAVAPNVIRLSLVGAPADPRDFAGAAGPGGSSAAPGDTGSGDEDFAVVALKYADISEIVGILTDDQSVRPNDTFQPQEPAFGSPGLITSNNGGAPPGAVVFNPNQDSGNTSLGRSVTASIGIDRRLNAIILHGSPARIAQLKARIAQLDVPLQSVSLETIFVELTDTGAKNVGIDLSNTSAQVFSASYGTGSFNPLDPVGHGLLSMSLQGAIYAQVQRGEGKIVSRPRITAQDGASAKIVTGDAIPILTNITLSGVTGVSQQVQYVTVGVTLQIEPRITADGFVTSHIFCEISSVTGTSQGYPTISQREALTSATVRDGDSFVIGGMTEDDDLSSSDAPPGHLPLVGGLFNHQTRTHSHTQLYIVVTPHIMTPPGSHAADNSGVGDVNQLLSPPPTDRRVTQAGRGPGD